MKKLIYITTLLLTINCLTILAQVQIDNSEYDSSCQINIQTQNNILVAEWETNDGKVCNVSFNLNAGYPLFYSIKIAQDSNSPLTEIVQNINPRFDITIGNREVNLWPYWFFDCVDLRPNTKYTANLDLNSVKVVSQGFRVKIIFSTFTAGSFVGNLVITLYSGSPLLHVEAVMATSQMWAAYIYDALFSGNFDTICFKDTNNQFISITPQGELSERKVRNRTIIAAFTQGCIAVFPPPHAYIFPTDFSDNQGFVQSGEGVFGTRQSPEADGIWRPWIKTDPGRKQHMGVFLLFSSADAEQTLQQVKEYTHNDAFKEVPGYLTMTHHYHPEITLNYMSGNPTGPDFVNGMKAMNIKIAQPLEFHIGGSLNDTGTYRLEEMQLMFELCEQYSDNDFVLIPGEEPNVHLWDTHWAYMFPQRVYYTQQRDASQPFRETIAPYGMVYHLGSEADVYEMLKLENGIGLTSHPRIKSSRSAPDNNAFTDIVQDDEIWFGADWKAMPFDLSETRLGSRSFGVMDDFAQRGYKKKLIGEVDTFELHPDHEIYAHMNINYLRLSSMPTAQDWSSVFQVIKDGDFFTSTGEVLMYSFSVNTTSVNVDLEWTFPLSFAEIIYGEGNEVKRYTIQLEETKEFDRQSFSWEIDLMDANWVRFEAWDIARNGTFTQTFWLKEPVQLDEVITSFTLINADNDTSVIEYDPLPYNISIDLSELPTKNLNIRANANPWIVGSVLFGFDDNPDYRIENGWPYSFANDANNSYYPWTPKPGIHTITATPYSGYGATERAGRPLAITFTVTDTNTLKGDVNGDSVIAIVDALLTAQYYVGLDPEGFDVSKADTDCDGGISIVDALLIAQYYVGLITAFC